MIPDRLKKIIFRKLYDDLSHVEIIPFKNSIWFVDRDEKYWYFELKKDGTLWWRYQFFSNFFILFSLDRDEYQSIMAEWVEEVLNSRVYRTTGQYSKTYHQVEEALNSRVYTMIPAQWHVGNWAEEVLNSRVNTTFSFNDYPIQGVEEVLNSKFDATSFSDSLTPRGMEEALNTRVDTTFNCRQIVDSPVEDVLKSRVLRTQVALHSTSVMAEGVLNSKGGELFDESIVEVVLSSIT